MLDGRLARLQARMREAGLGVLLIYTSFARPSAVAWLTHFVPYWNEGLLVVPPAGAPTLLAAFSKRMHDWIRSVSHVGEVRSVAALGRAAVDMVENLPAASAVGVIELDALPWTVAEPLLACCGERLTDASELFASIRQPADDTEIRLAQKAADIAGRAIASIPHGAVRASEVLAAIERSVRHDGAEEVLQRIAPDLGGGTTLRRLEGDCHLGGRYAIELSIAYKAAWVRVARCLSPNAPPSWKQAQRWTSDWATGTTGVSGGPPPGALAFWTLEACVGTRPFSVVGSAIGPRGTVAPGTLACYAVQLQLADGPWLSGGPVVVGGEGPGRLLA